MPDDLSTNKELLEVMKKLADVTSQFSKHLSKANNESQSLKNSTKEYSKNVKEASSEIYDISDNFAQMSKDIPFKASDVTAYNKKISEARGHLAKISKINTTNAEGAKKFDEQYKKVTASINDAKEALSSMKASGSTMVTEMGGGLGQIKSLWGAIASKSPKALKSQAQQSAMVGSNLKRMGTAISGSNKGILKLAGSVMGKLGGAIGGISKAMLGWPGLIAMGIKAIWDMGMKVDQFKKDINKGFARIRGPDIMTEDVEKQFQEFNSRLYDWRENLRVGLNAGQVREFLLAVYEAGTNIDRLNSSMGDYRSAVSVAARASKTLSMEVTQVGSIMHDMVSNLRMDMEDIDKLFVDIAFSAQKAGISSDRFYAAIQNANSGLSMYGVFLRASTKQLEKFNKLSVMGVEQTSDMVSDLSHQFDKMTTDQRFATIRLIKSAKGGSEAMRAAFKGAKSEFQRQLENVNIELKGKTGEEREKLEGKRSAILAKIKMATEAMAGDDLAMANILPMISDQAASIIAQLVKTKVGVHSMAKMNGAQLRTAESLLQATGINTDLLIKMKTLQLASNIKLENMLGLTEEGKESQDSVVNALGTLNKVMDKGNFSLINKVGNLASAVEEQDIQKIADAQGALKSYFRDVAGMSENQSETLSTMLSLDKVAADRFAEMVKNGESLNEEGLQDLYDTISENGNLDRAVFRKQLSSTEKLQEGQEKSTTTFDEIKDQTLSYKEMQDIMKDDATFRAANIKLLTGINDLVFGIFKQKDGAKTPAQERAEKEWEAAYGITGGWEMSSTKKFAEDRVAARDVYKETKGKMGDVKTSQEAFRVIYELENKIEEMKSSGMTNRELRHSKEYKALHDSLVIMKQMHKEMKEVDKELKSGKITEEKAEEKNKKINEGQEELLDGISDKNKTQLQNLLRQIELQQKMRGDTEQMVKMQKDLILGDKGTRKQIGSEISTIMKGKSKKAGLAAVKPRFSYLDLTDKQIMELAKEANVANEEADLIRPMTVTGASELFRLHRGETISPAPGPGAMGGGGTGSNITINVNATERDLAQKIANEVRGVMYQQQLTGMA